MPTTNGHPHGRLPFTSTSAKTGSAVSFISIGLLTGIRAYFGVIVIDEQFNSMK
ncbi:hypothetical protein ACRYI5_00510 [Furfurilactobacillus sp. WILCCON 0119]